MSTNKADYTWADGTDVEEYELEPVYNEWLDEAYGEVEIAGLSYLVSRVQQEVDPTAYRMGFLDWIDSLVQDGELTGN